MIWVIIFTIVLILICVLFYWKIKKSNKIKDNNDKPPDDIYPLY